MFFVLSKLVWLVASPAKILLGLVLLGALLLVRRPRGGRVLVAAGALGLLLIGALPLGALLLRPLEGRFPPLPAHLAPPDGIIVLGGSTDQALSAARGRVAISDAAERLTEAVALSRRFPAARLVFTGGSAAITGIAETEAADARRLWTELGVDPARITTEDRSRNTDENVRFSKALLQPRPGERWVLVTSAFHMPRAVALFEANDWPVIPDPVDYRTFGTARDWRPPSDVASGLALFGIAAREWIGLAVYAATGRTRSVLPPLTPPAAREG